MQNQPRLNLHAYPLFFRIPPQVTVQWSSAVFFDPSLPLMPGNVLWFLSELVSSERTTTEVAMPQRDGTGRQGQGPGMGGGVGQGGAGRGQGGGSSKGPGGNCICPSCGERVPHQLGTPCFEEKCPKCGTVMTRE